VRLHLLGLPHTITSPQWSSCAFAGEALHFSPRMQSVNYQVTYYGVEETNSGVDAQAPSGKPSTGNAVFNWAWTGQS